MSILMIPGILAAKVVGASEAAGIMVTNAWLLGLLAGAIYAWCRLRACSLKVSVAVSLVVGLGAGMLPFASTGFAEVALALAIVVGMIGLSATSRQWNWGPVVVGAAVGAAIVTRDDSIVLIAPWLVGGALLVGAAGRRTILIVRMFLGGLPFLALWAWYNAVRYGLPWKVGYDGVVRFNHSFLAGLYGLLASPGKGLILYAPVVVVGICGLVPAWRRDRTITVVAALLIISRIVFFAPYWGWYGGGGFGPRYVLPAVPVLALGIMEVGRKFGQLPAPFKFGTIVLAGLSIFIGFVGGAVSYESNSMYTALSKEPTFHQPTTTAKEFLNLYEARSTQVVVNRHMFDWGEFPITNEISSFFHRTDIVSDALNRPADKTRDGAALGVFAMGTVGLFFGHRRSRRVVT
jgi:hypothetical protein